MQSGPKNNPHSQIINNLPNGIDASIWGKLCKKYQNESDLKDKILPKASELEKLIKSNFKYKAKKADPKEVKAFVDKIEGKNREFKNLKKHRDGMPDEKKNLQDTLLKEISDLQLALTNLNIPFSEQLTLTVLKAFLHKLSSQDLSYEYFINHGLTKNDYNKFLKLNRVDDDSKIPDVTINGVEIGHPGIYLRKIKVENKLEAAHAACLGRLLKKCCQSLSGEQGEPCVIHGLTSPFGGFYIVCQGDINAPSIDDKLLGQCWAWRSKGGAIVFDSIEADEVMPSKTFFEYLGEILVEKGHTEKVACGTTSGISVGVESIFNAKEYLEDYNERSYRDSRKQRVICDKKYPFYTFKEGAQNLEMLSLLEVALLKNESLDKNDNLVKSINWALIEKRHDYLAWLKKIAEEKGRLTEINDLINQIDSFTVNNLNNITCLNILNKHGSTPLIMAAQQGNEEICLKLINQGADLNVKNLQGETALICAVKNGLIETCKKLVTLGAKIDERTTDKKSALMIAVKEGNTELASFLMEHGADVNIISSSDAVIGSILHFAIENQNSALSIQLLNYNIDVDAKDNFGLTPLCQAIRTIPKNSKFIPVALHLIERGADINAEVFGKNILSTAIEIENFEICKRLIEGGANLSEKVLGNLKSPKIKLMLENRIMKDLSEAMIEHISTENLENSNGKNMLSSFHLQTNNHIQNIREAKDLSELTKICKNMDKSYSKIDSLLDHAEILQRDTLNSELQNQVIIKPLKPVDPSDLF